MLKVLLVEAEELDVLPEEVERLVVPVGDLVDVERDVVPVEDVVDVEELDVSRTVRAGVLEDVWDEERDVEDDEEELSSLL